MLVDAGLTFREIVMNDPLPKGTIQQAVINFLDGRDDAALFGAMAVNAYVDERRMTHRQDIRVVNSRLSASTPVVRWSGFDNRRAVALPGAFAVWARYLGSPVVIPPGAGANATLTDTPEVGVVLVYGFGGHGCTRFVTCP